MNLNDNSSYTVTAPDLFLSENGVNVLITSTNEELINNFKLLFEKFIRSSVVFNVQQVETKTNSLPWMWHVSRTCEYMLVDLDTCAWEDIMAALMKRTDTNHTVIFYSEKQVRREAIKLINATSNYITINNLEELNKFLDIDTRYPGMPDE
jgi:elongation factor P hydroxylase